MVEQRKTRFAERLTMWMFTLAALGAGIVILEPELTWTWGTVSFKAGGHSFSDEIIGGVITLGVIGTITALIRFWFPGSETPPQISSKESNENRQVSPP